MVDVGKQKDFNIDNARNYLLQVSLPAMPDFDSAKEKLVYLSAYINLDLQCMVIITPNEKILERIVGPSSRRTC